MCLFSLLLVSSCMTCTTTHTRTNKWREKFFFFKEQTLHAALQAIHPDPLFDTVSFQHRNTTLNGTSKQWSWTEYWESRKTSVRHHILATTGENTWGQLWQPEAKVFTFHYQVDDVGWGRRTVTSSRMGWGGQEWNVLPSVPSKPSRIHSCQRSASTGASSMRELTVSVVNNTYSNPPFYKLSRNWATTHAKHQHFRSHHLTLKRKKIKPRIWYKMPPSPHLKKRRKVLNKQSKKKKRIPQ